MEKDFKNVLDFSYSQSLHLDWNINEKYTKTAIFTGKLRQNTQQPIARRQIVEREKKEKKNETSYRNEDMMR